MFSVRRRGADCVPRWLHVASDVLAPPSAPPPLPASMCSAEGAGYSTWTGRAPVRDLAGGADGREDMLERSRLGLQRPLSPRCSWRDDASVSPKRNYRRWASGCGQNPWAKKLRAQQYRFSKLPVREEARGRTALPGSRKTTKKAATARLKKQSPSSCTWTTSSSG